MILTSFSSLLWLLPLLLGSCLLCKYWLVCWRGMAVSVLQVHTREAQPPPTAPLTCVVQGGERVGLLMQRKGLCCLVCRPNIRTDLIPSDVQHHLWSCFHSFSLPRERAVSRTPEQSLPWLLAEAWLNWTVWLQVVTTPQKQSFPFSGFFRLSVGQATSWMHQAVLSPLHVLDKRARCRQLHTFRVPQISQYCRALCSTMEHQHSCTYHKVLAYRNLSNLESQ